MRVKFSNSFLVLAIVTALATGGSAMADEVHLSVGTEIVDLFALPAR